jgi:hypothetical protein
MARKSLKPQLNQIRAWVREGRTDAWIAHQLEISASQLKDFRKRHGLDADSEAPPGDVDLRDAIEAEIEAELDSAGPEPEAIEAKEEGATDEDAGQGEGGGRRRRRRRGGRGRGRGRKKGPLEATFDHGEKEGYGLWLDPAVKDDAVYSEHWTERRALKVTIEPERIVLEPVDQD